MVEMSGVQNSASFIYAVSTLKRSKSHGVFVVVWCLKRQATRIAAAAMGPGGAQVRPHHVAYGTPHIAPLAPRVQEQYSPSADKSDFSLRRPVLTRVRSSFIPRLALPPAPWARERPRVPALGAHPFHPSDLRSAAPPDFKHWRRAVFGVFGVC